MLTCKIDVAIVGGIEDELIELTKDVGHPPEVLRISGIIETGETARYEDRSHLQFIQDWQQCIQGPLLCGLDQENVEIAR